MPASKAKIKREAGTRAERRLSITGAEFVPAVVYQCNFCPENFDKSSNLRNHVVNHFKSELLTELPSSKPFACPCCPQLSRDKITLLRHYAFTHRKIYDHCSEADVAGTRISASDLGDVETSREAPTLKAKKLYSEAKVPPLVMVR